MAERREPDRPARPPARRDIPDKPGLEGLEATWSARWEARGDLRLRPDGHPSRGLLHRHAAAHRVRLAPHRPRLLVHPHRHRGPLPPDAGPRRVLPHGLGRQRAAHRAPGAELLRGPLRPESSLRPRLRPTGRARQGARLHLAAQLRGPVPPAHRRGRAGLRAPVADARACRWTGRTPTPPSPSGPSGSPSGASSVWPGGARSSSAPPPPCGTSTSAPRSAQAELEDRERPGAYHRLRFARVGARGGRRHRDHPARAAARLRGPGGPSRRRALPAPVRHRGRHAPLRRAGPGRGPRARRSREGVGHRHDLHLRRHHRRGLVARAVPPHPDHRRTRRPAAPGRVGHRGMGVRRPRSGQRRLRRAGRPDGQAGPGPHRRAAARSPAPSSGSRAPSPTRSSSTRRATGPSRSSRPGSGSSRPSRSATALLARGDELRWHPPYMAHRYRARGWRG